MSVASAEKTAPLSKEQLAEISARGRMLAEYDEAAGRATDAVMATHPKQDNGTRFVCRKADATWACVFGHLTADKLLIDYEALQGASGKEFQVKHHEPPLEDTGFFFAAVKAMMTAGNDFQKTAEKRPYNPTVLPAASGQFMCIWFQRRRKKAFIRWAVMRVIWSARMGARLWRRGSCIRAFWKRTSKFPQGQSLPEDRTFM